MRKSVASALFVFFVVLAILASAVPAGAQIRYGYIPQTPDGWYYMVQGDQIAMLTADNLGRVSRLTNQLPRSLGSDLRWNGNAYGINTGRGFYPMYDQNRQPLSGRQRVERAGGIVAIVDGARRVVNNPRSAGGWIEAAVGAVLVNDSRYRGNDRRDNVIVTPQTQGQQSVRIARDGIPVAVGARPESPTPTPVFNPSSSQTSSQSVRPTCLQQGMITLENQSVGPLRVFVKGQTEPFVVLLQKEQKCAPTEGEYVGQIVGTVVSSDGLTGKVGAAPSKPQSLPGLILVWR